MKDIKLKKKYYLYIVLAVVLLLSLLTGCSEVKEVFVDTDKLVSEMTKSELLWSVLVMSIIGSSIGS